MYEIIYTKTAVKEVEKIKIAKLDKNCKQLIDIIRNNPFKIPPSYDKLVGDLKGLYSRRINIKHRLVYQVYENEKIIKIISLWTHYENI